MDYLTLKWLHVLSSTLLFGTGLGSAFYLFFAWRSGDVRAIAVVARLVVIADWLFTAPTAVFQPASGIWLAHLAGMPLSSRWLAWSLALYALAVACWLPVVWLQMRLRDLAQAAAAAGTPLPAAYRRHQVAWVLLGIPAFFAMVAIFALMVLKPA